jgi:hypothetical protein
MCKVSCCGRFGVKSGLARGDRLVVFRSRVALAAKYNKKLGLLMTAGITTPRWIYPAGVYEFMVTTERGPHIVKECLPVGSVLMTACLAVLMTETVSEYS